MILNYAPVQDSYIYQGFCNSSYDGSNVLFIGQYSGVGTIMRSLLKFDLSSCPSNVTVTNAVLKLYVYKKETSGTQTIKIYQYDGDFDSGITWNKASGVPVSYIEDKDITNVGEIEICLLDTVKSWLNNPNINQCIQIRGIENKNALIGFRSKEYSDILMRPELIIEYTESSTVDNTTPTGNFEIYDCTVSELGQKITTTFTTENVGTENYNEGLAVLQISDDNVEWADEKRDMIPPGNIKVMSTHAARRFERLSLLSSMLPDIAAGKIGEKVDIKNNIDLNMNGNEDTLYFKGEVPVRYKSSDSAVLQINENGIGEVKAAGTAQVRVFEKNIDPDDYNLEQNCIVMEAYCGVITSNTMTANPAQKSIVVSTQYNSNFAGIDENIKLDGFIETAIGSFDGLIVDVYYSSNPAFPPASTVLFPNISLSGTKVYISEITGILASLKDNNGKMDNFKIVVKSGTGTFELMQYVMSGPEIIGGGIDPNAETILAKDGPVALIIS